MGNIVLLYMPVIHRGYLEFLERHASREWDCVLLGKKALGALGSDDMEYVLRKDMAIRGLDESLVRDFIRSRDLYRSVELLDPDHNYRPVLSVVAPDEDVTQLAAKRFFPNAVITADTHRLRYDRIGSKREDPVPAVTCCSDHATRTLMGVAVTEAGKSKDWWLSVGAIISRGGIPLLTAYNAAALDPDLVNILGDPRSAFSRGVNTEDTLAAHAERRLVARAAKLGLSLLGTDAYVTHFPCVPCAESLAEAGVKRLFFKQGYSRLEAAELLQAKGIEIIQVV